MMMYTIEKSTLDKLASYLWGRPYGEVRDLFPLLGEAQPVPQSQPTTTAPEAP